MMLVGSSPEHSAMDFAVRNHAPYTHPLRPGHRRRSADRVHPAGGMNGIAPGTSRVTERAFDQVGLLVVGGSEREVGVGLSDAGEVDVGDAVTIAALLTVN